VPQERDHRGPANLTKWLGDGRGRAELGNSGYGYSV